MAVRKLNDFPIFEGRDGFPEVRLRRRISPRLASSGISVRRRHVTSVSHRNLHLKEVHHWPSKSGSHGRVSLQDTGICGGLRVSERLAYVCGDKRSPSPPPVEPDLSKIADGSYKLVCLARQIGRKT